MLRVNLEKLGGSSMYNYGGKLYRMEIFDWSGIQTRKFRHMTPITKLIADLGINGSAKQWRWRWSTLFKGG